MKYLLILLSILLMTSGCEEKKTEHANTTPPETKVLPKIKESHITQAPKPILKTKKIVENTTTHVTPKATQEKTKLNTIGIGMKDGVITIDTEKTKDFFNTFSQKMQTQMQKISDDLKKGILETKGAGIEVNDTHIHIDLNKTKSLLNIWTKKIETFSKEFDDIANQLDSTTNKGK